MSASAFGGSESEVQGAFSDGQNKGQPCGSLGLIKLRNPFHALGEGFQEASKKGMCIGKPLKSPQKWYPKKDAPTDFCQMGLYEKQKEGPETGERCAVIGLVLQ